MGSVLQRPYAFVSVWQQAQSKWHRVPLQSASSLMSSMVHLKEWAKEFGWSMSKPSLILGGLGKRILLLLYLLRRKNREPLELTVNSYGMIFVKLISVDLAQRGFMEGSVTGRSESGPWKTRQQRTVQHIMILEANSQVQNTAESLHCNSLLSLSQLWYLHWSLENCTTVTTYHSPTI